MNSQPVNSQPAPPPPDRRPSAEPLPAPETPLRALHADLAQLSPAMQRVAGVILEDLDAGAQALAPELAERAGVSLATISRFARRIGYASFADLQQALSRELGRAAAEGPRTITAGIRVEDDARTVVDKVLNDVVRVMEDTRTSVSPAVLDAAAERIVAAGRVFLFGIGASELVARDLQLKLERIGLNVPLAADLHRGLTLVNVLDAGDVAVCVSHSGATRETVDVARAARARGTWTVALTGRPLSPLAADADAVLLGVAGAESDLRPAAMGSRMSQLAIVDALFVLVAQRTYDRTQQLLAGSWGALHHLRQEQTHGRP